VADHVGPSVTGAAASPNPANAAATPTITGNASDAATGDNPVTAAEYFVDVDGADGTGTAMAATDGTFDTSSEAITATLDSGAFAAMTEGSHTVYVHAQDDLGNWGPTVSFTFVKDVTAPVISNPGDQTFEATGPLGALGSYTQPAATDAIDGTDTVLCNHNS